jgi:hypothetical protein
MMGGYGLSADTGAIVYGAFMGGSVVWAGRRVWCVRGLAGVEKWSIRNAATSTHIASFPSNVHSSIYELTVSSSPVPVYERAATRGSYGSACGLRL